MTDAESDSLLVFTFLALNLQLVDFGLMTAV